MKINLQMIKTASVQPDQVPPTVKNQGGEDN